MLRGLKTLLQILDNLFVISIGAFLRTVYLSVLSGLREAAAMRLSNILINYIPQHSWEDEHYRKVIAALLMSHLISCSQYDDLLARLVELHRNQPVVDLALSLLQDPQVFISALHYLWNLTQRRWLLPL